jgi:nickel-dependent lactate racemase
MMDFTWKFAQDRISFSVPDKNVKAVLRRKDFDSAGGFPLTVERALENPVGTPRLREIIAQRKARSVVIVVNDITRPTPYDKILPPLMSEIRSAGIADDQVTLLIANGIHREQTADESRAMYGEEICERHRVVNHCPDRDLVSLGTLRDGFEVQVNRLIKESDIVITTGVIGLHYIAGYSGGRKSIIPGTAGRAAITATHALMADPRACLGNIKDNPVNDLLLEGGRRAGVDFIVNVITDDSKQIAAAVAGDMEKAWLKGVAICQKAILCNLESPADIVIAGCGGYPKDINLYQAQKALESSVQAVREGGVIILVAGCQEGLGEDTFARWVNEAQTPEDIKQRFMNDFELGGHKAYAICRTLEKCQVVLVSCLDQATVEKTFMVHRSTVEEALEYAYRQVGENPAIVVMPEAPTIAVQVGNKTEGAHK